MTAWGRAKFAINLPRQPMSAFSHFSHRPKGRGAASRRCQPRAVGASRRPAQEGGGSWGRRGVETGPEALAETLSQ